MVNFFWKARRCPGCRNAGGRLQSAGASTAIIRKNQATTKNHRKHGVLQMFHLRLQRDFCKRLQFPSYDLTLPADIAALKPIFAMPAQPPAMFGTGDGAEGVGS